MKRNITVYVVGHNMAGYLGDNDPYIVTGKRRAISASYQDAKRDLHDLNEYVTDKHDRYTMSGKNGDYWLQCLDTGYFDSHHASYHYWVITADAELTLSHPESYSGHNRVRCFNCESEIEDGDEAYYVSLCDCYLCAECV